MKIDNQVLSELKKIRAAIDDMYNKLDRELYKKNVATRVNYSPVNPYETVSENFEFISKKIRKIQESEVIGD
tara:strand:+ start:242 stop:457 length:216 start_codon:yes stop_codon:yes gene_type:complete